MNDKPTFNDYLIEVSNRCREIGQQQRLGQLYYNVASEMRHDLVMVGMLGSFGTLDPFHVDTNIPAFLAWLEKEWDK